jgi:hypothetical protein
MPIPKTKELLEPLVEEMRKMNEKLCSIEEKMCQKEVVVHTPDEPVRVLPVENKYPVPTEYREAVSSMLNNRFEVEIEPQADSPMFRFTILVPREYSPLNDKEFVEAHGDRRPKMLGFGDGLPGVRGWVETVWNNFSAEMRAKIKADQQADGY